MTRSIGASARRNAVGWITAFALSSALVSLPASAGAPTPPEQEWEWARVRAKNNEAWTGVWPHGPPPPFGQTVTRGAVGYNYRVATTPVTNRQWLEFVRAYDRNIGDPQQSARFLGDDIIKLGNEYLMFSATANMPVSVSWRYAAMYMNWLHNDKAESAQAFLTGVYEVNTQGGTIPPHLVNIAFVDRASDAKYWIPSMDEWTKAMHYDPNRHGEGQGGYWLHPGMQDTRLLSALPEDGGQTNAGVALRVDVGSYPHVQSPWGALDASGGESEWVEDRSETGVSRLARMSNWIDGGPNAPDGYPDNRWDHIASVGGGLWDTDRRGFRVATIIPAPGGAGLIALSLIVIASWRSRR